MELQTIVTLKQVRFEALVHCLQLYMEQDECVCGDLAELPLFRGLDSCGAECEACMWCIARKALRGVGRSIIGGITYGLQ